jgi:GNAT superfamily N-acetyltransferase
MAACDSLGWLRWLGCSPLISRSMLATCGGIRLRDLKAGAEETRALGGADGRSCRMAEIQIEPYTPEMSEACVDLERACPQGSRYRLSFQRTTFHRRAEIFASSRILVARSGERIIATVASARKRVRAHGEEVAATFVFDARVHPEFRGRGLSRRLGATLHEEANAAGSVIAYTYCIEENAAIQAVVRPFNMLPAGGYRYLVWPVYRSLGSSSRATSADPRHVHERLLQSDVQFDFYCDPREGGSLVGHVGSFLDEEAGCSLWSNAGILGEVVESLPPELRMARRVFGIWPVNQWKWPRIPAPGEALQSWFVYDFFARTRAAAVGLMEQVNNLALRSAIDYCYLVVSGTPPWLGWLRARTLRMLSPLVRYRLLVRDARGRQLVFEQPYIDIRDL